MSNIVIPPLKWENRMGSVTAPWYAEVFDENGYHVWFVDGRYHAGRYQWTGPYRDTANEAKIDAEADYQKTIKRLLKIE